MSDNFVTCRHCGIGINYACDHEDDDVPKEEVAALRAENVGLREALRRIADVADGPAYRIATEALAGVER